MNVIVSVEAVIQNLMMQFKSKTEQLWLYQLRN